MGGGDIPEVIKLDLLTEEQKDALGQLLTGTMASLGKLELGTPYGGALESSYSPYTPTYGEGSPGGTPRDRGRDREGKRDGGGRQAGEEDKTVIRNRTVVPKDTGGTVGASPPTEGKTVLGEILDMVQKRQEPTGMIQPGTPQVPPTGMPPTEISTAQPGLPPAGDEQTMMMRMLESILSPSPMPISPVNVPPAADALPPETQPVSPISQMLTQPLTQPFREGMTGNFPRRTLRR